MNIYKKWIINTFIMLVLAFLSIIGFNYKVDVAGLFSSSSYLSKAAKAIVDGHIVAGLGDEAFDDRLFQVLLIKEIKKNVDAIALGSSRTKELRQEYLNDENVIFYNHSVNGASFHDYVAIVGAYKKIKGYIPKEVIIGVDPWVFNKNSGRNLWKNISQYYDYGNREMSLESIKTNKLKKYLEKAKQLVNYDYTISNIKYFYKSFKNKDNQFYIAKSTEVNDYLRGSDGSIYYPSGIYSPSEKNLLMQSKHYTTGGIYSLENYHELSFIKEFNTFIKYLKKSGTTVTFFLAPYNPVPYDILGENSKYRIDEVEVYLREYAKENDIQVLGSYNPHTFNLNMMDFFDGMHVKEESIKRIFKIYR